MKKIIISVVMLALCCTVQAQYKQEGTVFKAVSASRKKSVKDTIITKYSYQDKKGNKYPIILNKKTGSCYCWVNNKNGKPYSKYFPELSAQIAREYGIEYKPKNK